MNFLDKYDRGFFLQTSNCFFLPVQFISQKTGFHMMPIFIKIWEGLYVKEDTACEEVVKKIPIPLLSTINPSATFSYIIKIISWQMFVRKIPLLDIRKAALLIKYTSTIEFSNDIQYPSIFKAGNKLLSKGREDIQMSIQSYHQSLMTDKLKGEGKFINAYLSFLQQYDMEDGQALIDYFCITCNEYYGLYKEQVKAAE